MFIQRLATVATGVPIERRMTPEAGAFAVARIGDIFDLGAHRVVCGDRT